MRSNRKYVLGFVVLALSLVITSAHASASRPHVNKKPTTMPSAQSAKPADTPSADTTKVSKWILPSAPTPATNAILVNAGSAIPVRFQLFTLGATPVEQTSGTVFITGIPVSCPRNVASPTPTANKITTNVTPGKSKASEVRYQGKSWKAIWKSDEQAQGCFKLHAALSTTTLILDSPVFVIYRE